MKLYLLLILTCQSRSQEVPTPSSQLQPRDFNHHSYLQNTEPTQQGPVLFPNDAPPPPRPPLIVTSRPLVESIARSELGENNTETSQSQSRVSFVPFLAKVNDYRPYIPSPTFDYQFLPTRVPYADVVKKTRLNLLARDNRYNDYEEQTVLPPIYKALSEHAKQKVLKLNHQKQNQYQVNQPVPVYSHHQQNHDVSPDNDEYDQSQNYAFSYTVKDQKTGDDFSHSQHSSGAATNGEYRVRLPDGRMQIVSYTADENGYKADVRYDDEDKTAGNTIEEGYNQHNDYVRHNERNDYGAHNHHNEYKPPKFSYVTLPQNDYVTDYKKYVSPQHNNYYAGNNQQADYSNKQADYSIKQADYTNKQVDYTDRSNKQYYVGVSTDRTDLKSTDHKGDKDYYQYPDISKEYYNDYSSEYNSNYEPHRSKFSTFVDNKNGESNKATVSTVKPSYEELKDLFVTKSAYKTQQNYDSGDIKVPSTTPLPYDGTTEHVVYIGGKTPNLYTNIKHSLPLNLPVPVYSTPNVVVATTPRSYLESTIANLKNKVNLGTKPVLSDNFISRINKYINFN